jgi:hypothetical protein
MTTVKNRGINLTGCGYTQITIDDVPYPARLIEAAPDMLAALNSALSSGANSYRAGDKYDDVVIARGAYEDIRAAIAKATGGGKP